jgi:Xaa-Pro aminopeptidase
VLGDYGVRIEDIVLVTDTGADVFGPWQSGPNSPA